MRECETEPPEKDWAEPVAGDLLARGIVRPGLCLFLGAGDTGKTFLAAALANQLTAGGPIAFVDADIGQSHIGPPATVGLALRDRPCGGLAAVAPAAIAFVGDITPVGHMLQFAAAIARCVAAVRDKADITLIDTPGLVSGGAAVSLWWAVHRILRPSTIIALRREDEIDPILAGLTCFDTHIERLRTPASLRTKSSEQRRRHRLCLFADYFASAALRTLDLAEVAVQTGRNTGRGDTVNRLVALSNRAGDDLSLGLLKELDGDQMTATVLTPLADTSQVRCLTIGDITVESS